MENEFIPYEQALALKELGFDEPCLAKYIKYGEDVIENYNQFSVYFIENLENTSILKPLYQQAFNDSWIKIESESDLPNQDDFKFNETFIVYYYCKGYCNAVFKGSIDRYTFAFRDIEYNLVKEKVTHYQPYVVPDNPTT